MFMVDLNYLIMRLETLEVLEEGYGPAIPINQLTISKKALKQMAKNPNIKRLVSNTINFNTQLLHIVTGHGQYSFAVGTLRGLGERGEDNTYILNWIGTHEDYNKEKSKK